MSCVACQKRLATLIRRRTNRFTALCKTKANYHKIIRHQIYASHTHKCAHAHTHTHRQQLSSCFSADKAASRTQIALVSFSTFNYFLHTLHYKQLTHTHAHTHKGTHIYTSKATWATCPDLQLSQLCLAVNTTWQPLTSTHLPRVPLPPSPHFSASL